MVILPPPPVEMVADLPEEIIPPESESDRTEPHRDPDWWSRGWIIRADDDPPATPASATVDSVAILLMALGVERDFMERTRPDSLLASRLFLMQVEDSFQFDELKPYLAAMTRSRAYADMFSRVADMYDDFLSQEIMTPD